jgi:hypothetical protein
LRILAVTTAVVLLGGLTTWGHASWAEKMFSVELPTLEDPARTTAIIVGIDPPFAWVATQFPSNVAFTQVQGMFPEAMPEYGNRIHEMVKTRGGPVFALLPAAKPWPRPWRIAWIARIRETASNLGITSSESGCAVLRSAAINLRLHALVTMLDQPVGKAKCSIDLLPSDMVNSDQENDGMEKVDRENKAFLSVAANQLANYGFAIDPASCRTYLTYIGKQQLNQFQWCKVLRSELNR